MKIVLIGSGNVATVLGRLIIKNGHTVTHVISPHVENAATLANELNCTYSHCKQPITPDCDLVILSVSDSGLENIHANVKSWNKPVVHTSGSVSIEILKKYADVFGVLYPLQTLRKEMTTIPEIPFLVDGSTDDMYTFIEGFAKTLSHQVQRANDEERSKLHLAAVISSNFTNYMYKLAEQYCIDEGVNFTLLHPLILETAQRATLFSPGNVQTGPAIRKDIQTLDKHLRLLNAYPKLRTTYLRITDSIMNP
ncbi:MAG: hypothetical protein ABS68_09980 [Niastella sp. SCN 39-18]|nr:DUF2520 domain-containing protein [Sphingobacteriales bacterium]ODT52029.1 MAG: hypothetical protein ABS68_09980 [Niastella sp. SCN 39-18]OJW11132.1 MAG: hypothetical protein BGO53_01330 [Sphingobacteriales bacterium 39-19]